MGGERIPKPILKTMALPSGLDYSYFYFKSSLIKNFLYNIRRIERKPVKGYLFLAV